MNDPFAQLAAMNQDLQVRASVLRSQVIKRLRARRAALRPALLTRVGSGVKKALGAMGALARAAHAAGPGRSGER